MQLTCPECEKVLKPAAPLAPGKKVKCPKCGTTFTVPEDRGADDTPKKAKAGTAPTAVKKKGDDAAAPEKPPEKPAATSGDEDDDGGTYGFHPSPEEQEEAEDDKGKGKAKGKGEGKGKPKIDYAPDTSIKDLRGPAQSAVIKPTNMFIAMGVGGFIGWIALLVLLSIPMLFPIDPDEGTKDSPKAILRIRPGIGPFFGKVGEEFTPPRGATAPGAAPPPQPGAPAAEPAEKENVSFYQFLGYDYRELAEYAWYIFIFMLSPIYIGLCYAAVQTYGAVKAQNLESREWGVASSIMAMIPISMVGAAWTVGMFASFLLNMFLDDTETVDNTVYGILAIFGVISIAGGIWLIMTLVQPDVIAGFEFVPDSDDVKAGNKDKDKDKDKEKDKPKGKKRP